MWSLRLTCIWGATFGLAGFATAKQCAQFDTSANLYLFGGEQDYNLGQNTSWSSPTPKALTTQGRPPWTGNNTICALSQYSNALYVLDADSANPGDIYIFDFGAGTWSKQTTTSAPDLATGSSILDHDTNVLFALSASGSLYTLDMSTVTTAAAGNALAWEAVSDPNFSTGGAQPVLAEASNHIIFFNVPSNPSGSANMFVVHYSYFQPEVQAFAEVGGASANFPTSHGQAVPIPLASNNAGNQVVFIPDDASHTYVITHWTSPSNWAEVSDAPAGIANFINTTQTLPPPSLVDPAASYAASDTTLVQLSSAGDVYYLPAAFGNGYAVQSSAAWQKLDFTLAGLNGSPSPASSSVSSSTTGSSTSTSTSTVAQQSRMSTASTMTTLGTATPSATQTGGSSAHARPLDNIITWNCILLLVTAVSAAWF